MKYLIVEDLDGKSNFKTFKEGFDSLSEAWLAVTTEALTRTSIPGYIIRFKIFLESKVESRAVNDVRVHVASIFLNDPSDTMKNLDSLLTQTI